LRRNFEGHQKQGNNEKVLVTEGVLTANANVITDYLSETIDNNFYDSVLLTWEEGDQKTTYRLLNDVHKQWKKEGKRGAILMVDNPHDVDALYIANLNLGATDGPSLFNYGELVVTENEDGDCQGVVSGSCAPGYNNLQRWGDLCYFWCCGGPGAGTDCGCGNRQQRACGI
jgi:hypothetical protein